MLERYHYLRRKDKRIYFSKTWNDFLKSMWRFSVKKYFNMMEKAKQVGFLEFTGYKQSLDKIYFPMHSDIGENSRFIYLIYPRYPFS